ncbi:MAG: hypothetical protein PUB22_01410 [Clostridiales bacterium]|nr:hypothetical protein [Clostridiales bacterium]
MPLPWKVGCSSSRAATREFRKRNSLFEIQFLIRRIEIGGIEKGY